MKIFFLLLGLFFFAAFFIVGNAYGQNLATWELSSLSGVTAGSVNSSTNAVGISPGVLSRGAGLTATSITAAYSSSGWYATNGTATTLATAVTNNDYYQFTVPIEAGMTADITSVQAYFQA